MSPFIEADLIYFVFKYSNVGILISFFYAKYIDMRNLRGLHRNLIWDKVDTTADGRAVLASRGIGPCRGCDLSMPDFISKFDLIAEGGRGILVRARTFNYIFHL